MMQTPLVVMLLLLSPCLSINIDGAQQQYLKTPSEDNYSPFAPVTEEPEQA